MLILQIVTVRNSFITCRRTTPYTHSRLTHFKNIHNRVMTNKILHEMKLVDDPNCLYCGSEESLIYAFLECENNMMLAWPGSERESSDDFICFVLTIRLIVFILRFQPFTK